MTAAGKNDDNVPVSPWFWQPINLNWDYDSQTLEAFL